MNDPYLSSGYNPLLALPQSVTDSLSSLFSSINTTPQQSVGSHIGTTAISPSISNTSNSFFPIREHGSIEPNYRIDLTKSENGGFVIQVYTDPFNSYAMYKNKPKVYICTNVENLGVDIQNALVVELLKG
jgi:hypothetical protein